MSSVIVTKKQEGKIWFVELNTPEKRNVLTQDKIVKLTEVFASAYQDSLVQAIVLSGRGVCFCAGGDLNWMLLDEEKTDMENVNEVNILFKLFQTIDNCPVPVIGFVHGTIYGGGIGLVAVCDIVATQRDAIFCFSELKLSLIPSTISPFVLKKWPLYKVKEYMLTGKTFSPKEAQGLIHFEGSKEECENYIKEITDRMLQFDKQAVSQTKALLDTIYGRKVEEVKEYCVEALAKRRKSPSALERIKRFLRIKK